MNAARAILFLIFALLLQMPAKASARAFVSPSGRLEIRLVDAPSPSGKNDPNVKALVKVESGGRLAPSAIKCDSRVLAENHGFGWLDTDHFEWVEDRYLVFDDGDGLCVLDGESNQLLLNQTFTAYTRSPGEVKWAAIRRRPIGRNQERLNGDENDTLWIIAPSDLAKRSSGATSETPFNHVAALTLAGTAVASPLWSPDGSKVAVARQWGDALVVDLIDPKAMRLETTVPFSKVALTKEEVLSPWIIADVDRKVLEEMKASRVFSRGPTPPEKPLTDGLRDTKQPGDGPGPGSVQPTGEDRPLPDRNGAFMGGHWAALAGLVGATILIVGSFAFWRCRSGRSSRSV